MMTKEIKETTNQLKNKIEEFSHPDKKFEEGVIKGMFYSVTLMEQGRDYADKKVVLSPGKEI